MTTNADPIQRISACLTTGAHGLGIPEHVTNYLIQHAINRYLNDSGDYITTIESIGINVLIGDGNKTIETRLISELPRISNTIHIVVDDYGLDSKEGLVVTIRLASEY